MKRTKRRYAVAVPRKRFQKEFLTNPDASKWKPSKGEIRQKECKSLRGGRRTRKELVGISGQKSEYRAGLKKLDVVMVQGERRATTKSEEVKERVKKTLVIERNSTISQRERKDWPL